MKYRARVYVLLVQAAGGICVPCWKSNNVYSLPRAALTQSYCYKVLTHVCFFFPHFWDNFFFLNHSKFLLAFSICFFYFHFWLLLAFVHCLACLFLWKEVCRQSAVTKRGFLQEKRGSSRLPQQCSFPSQWHLTDMGRIWQALGKH